MEKSKEQMAKVEYGNRFLDDEKYRKYIGDYISFVRSGGAREEVRRSLLKALRHDYPDLGNVQAEQLIDEQFREYLDEQDRIMRLVAEKLEEFIGGVLLKEELQKMIPEKYKRMDAKTQAENTEEDIKYRQKFWSLDGRIEHFFGNYVQIHMRK